FCRIPVYSLPANLVMVPLYALIVMPAGLLAEVLALTGLETLAGALMQLSGLAIKTGLNILIAISELPAGQLWATQPPLWLGLLYMAGMLFSGWLLFINRRLKAAACSVLVLMAYLGFVLTEASIPAPRWVVWDVGQGAASTLLLPDKQVIVVDVPGRAGSRFNGGTTVAAGLRHLGLTHVDILILSHAQSDHLGGAISLMQNLNKIGQIWLPDVPSARQHQRVKAVVSYAQQRGISIRWLARGDHIALAGEGRANTSLTVLWPPRSFDPSNTNNTSLVFAVHLAHRTHQTRLLWPGDIEVAAEKALISAQLGKTDLMLIPHHGSRSSSHAAFIQAVQPSLAIAQTGYANHYGFPKDDVVARYQNIGAEIYNTANGALQLRWPDDGNKSAVEVQQWQADSSSRREWARNWYQSL
ncbi:MAG: ComEC/Rec2 family competence protein, partial [Mariprofundus sp.]